MDLAMVPRCPTAVGIQRGGSAVTRRLVLVLTLVVALCATVVATATADVEADVGLEIRLPLAALPLGPGPLYPLDNYGPRADDNAVLRWSEQTLAAIRALKTGPTVNARALAIVHTAMYDAWSAYDAPAVPPGGPGPRPPSATTPTRARPPATPATGPCSTCSRPSKATSGR